MKKRHRKKRRANSSRSRYSKALLRAIRMRGRKHRSGSRRRIAANGMTQKEADRLNRAALKRLNEYRKRHGLKPVKRLPLGTSLRAH